jgi:hypothetical protein
MKINLLASVALMIYFASLANAQTQVTFGGEINTELGVRNQSKDYKNQNPHASRKLANGPDVFPKNELHEAAIVNDTHINVALDMQSEEGVRYGGEMELTTDASLNKYNVVTHDRVGLETFAFAETDFGRLEAGSTTGAYNDMRISGATVAKATGGIDGDVKYWWNPYIYRDGSIVLPISPNPIHNTLSPQRSVKKNFINSPNLPSNYDHGGEANAAKITYITPSIEGLRVGVSYVPDIAQHGSTALTHRNTQRIEDIEDEALGYFEVLSSTVAYENKIDKTKFKMSLSGEVGRIKDVKEIIYAALPVLGDPEISVYSHRHQLKAWEVGAGIEDSGFAAAASYGNWGKSGEIKRLKDRGCKRTDYWTLGGSYATEDTGFSITYFGSRRCGIGSSAGYEFIADAGSANYNIPLAKNELSKPKKVEILSFGIDTKLAEGFAPFGELSFFKLNENNGAITGTDRTNLTPGDLAALQRARHNKKNEGFILVSGVKIKF